MASCFPLAEQPVAIRIELTGALTRKTRPVLWFLGTIAHIFADGDAGEPEFLGNGADGFSRCLQRQYLLETPLAPGNPWTDHIHWCRRGGWHRSGRRSDHVAGEEAMLLPIQVALQRITEVTGWAEAVANLRLPSKPCVTLSRYTAPRDGSP